MAEPEGSALHAAETESPDVRRWLDAVDFEAPARTPLGAWLRLFGWAVAIFAFVSVTRSTIAPLTFPSTKSPLGPDEYEGFRYGMTLETREAIFDELAIAEESERRRAIESNTWQGHLWSREDDRGQQELTLARALAKKHGVSLSQVYLVLDEAIREKWPGPDGKPLKATTPPQDPRSTW
jgi:hypothetical protein